LAISSSILILRSFEDLLFGNYGLLLFSMINMLSVGTISYGDTFPEDSNF